jgi:hypothetical protein
MNAVACLATVTVAPKLVGGTLGTPGNAITTSCEEAPVPIKLT